MNLSRTTCLMAMAIATAVLAIPVVSEEAEPTLAVNKLGRSKPKLLFASSRYFIRNWALLGPFYFEPKDLKDGETGSIMEKRFVQDEANLEPVEGQEVADGRKWLCYTPLGDRPEVIDLDAFYQKLDNAVVYAVAHVHSPEPVRDAVLLCGSDDYLRVWINGQLVHTYNEKRRGTEADSDVVRGVDLKKGWNKVVVKCVDILFDWTFCLRFAPPADKDATSFGGIRVSSPAVEPKVRYEPIPRVSAPPPGKIVAAIDLKGEWLLKADPEGVSAEKKWQEPAINTKDWRKLKVPGDFDEAINLFEKGKLCPPFSGISMTEQGLYNGIAWLRKDVDVPAEWKGKRIFLELGRIDDMDVTYINGYKVGQTDSGTNPKDFWSAPRTYEVNAEFVKFGAENVIAVMILDNNAKGGIYGPEVRLVCRENR